MLDSMPVLNSASDDFKTAFMQQAINASLPSGTTVCHQGNICQQLPILLSGQARVFKLSEAGKQLDLPHIVSGYI